MYSSRQERIIGRSYNRALELFITIGNNLEYQNMIVFDSSVQVLAFFFIQFVIVILRNPDLGFPSYDLDMLLF